MVNLKLKSNIFELVCRICLKIHKERYSIFEHSKDNRLLADLMVEIIHIQVLKDDSFPKAICSNCLERLEEAYNFKTLAVQSNEKLQNFCQNKSVEKDQEENTLNVILQIKEEPTYVKIETIETGEVSLLDKGHTQQYFTTINAVDNPNSNRLDSTKSNLVVIDLESAKTNKNLESNFLNDLDVDGLSSDTISESSDADSESSSSGNENSEDEIGKSSNLIYGNAEKCNENGKVSSNDSIEAELPLRRQPMMKRLTRQEKLSKRLYCKLCSKMFTYYYYYSIHVQEHNGNTPYKCEVCGKGFVIRSMLKQHKKNHVIDRQFSCDVCGKSFKVLNGLKVHQTVHSEERPFKCEACDKCFKYEGVLRTHMLRHDNIRKHICEICGMAFIDRTGLLNHKTTHSTERSFTCSICGKDFKRKDGLYRHIKVHSGVKPHACDQCDKRFSEKTLLQEHMRIHSGDKPFTCEICGKAFRQRSCICRHMRIHTGETPYPCKKCPSMFKFSHHLQNHMKVHHKDVPQ